MFTVYFVLTSGAIETWSTHSFKYYFFK